VLLRIILVLIVDLGWAQSQSTGPASAIPNSSNAQLPGKGMAQHPFLYCGEWQHRSTSEQTMYIVRGGKVVWSYTNPLRGELGDCTMLSNGNIVFSRQLGASEITPDKKMVWNYDAPPGTEIHTAYPIDKTRVLIMQNGNPAKLLVINKKSNKIEKELTLPTRSSNTHGQFRHVRMTRKGTFLVAHLDLGKVVEYDKHGRELWSVPAPSAWAAVRLTNGNTLISGNQHGYVREVNSKDRRAPEATDMAPRGDFRSRFDVLQSIDSAKTAAPSATAVMGSIFTSAGTPISLTDCGKTSRVFSP